MGAFSYHRFIFLLACIDCWKVYNRLVSACTVKTAIKVQHLCVSTVKVILYVYGFNWQKTGTFVGLLPFLSPSFFFACAATNRGTTIIEDTRLTLAAIPFKVEASNSLIFCHYKRTRKNLPSFRSLSVYNSLLKFSSILRVVFFDWMHFRYDFLI